MFPPSWRLPKAQRTAAALQGEPARSLPPCPVLLLVLYDPDRRAPASERDFLGNLSLGCMMENMWLAAHALGIGFHIVSSLAAGPTAEEVKRLLAISAAPGAGFRRPARLPGHAARQISAGPPGHPRFHLPQPLRQAQGLSRSPAPEARGPNLERRTPHRSPLDLRRLARGVAIPLPDARGGGRGARSKHFHVVRQALRHARLAHLDELRIGLQFLDVARAAVAEPDRSPPASWLSRSSTEPR